MSLLTFTPGEKITIDLQTLIFVEDIAGTYVFRTASGAVFILPPHVLEEWSQINEPNDSLKTPSLEDVRNSWYNQP